MILVRLSLLDKNKCKFGRMLKNNLPAAQLPPKSKNREGLRKTSFWLAEEVDIDENSFYAHTL